MRESRSRNTPGSLLVGRGRSRARGANVGEMDDGAEGGVGERINEWAGEQRKRIQFEGAGLQEMVFRASNDAPPERAVSVGSPLRARNSRFRKQWTH